MLGLGKSEISEPSIAITLDLVQNNGIIEKVIWNNENWTKKDKNHPLLCVAVLDMETPCPSDALSARFSVRGNALTTFLFIVSKVWIVILSLNQIGFRT